MGLFKRLQRKMDDGNDNNKLTTKSFKILKYLGAGTFGKVFQVEKKYGEDKNKIYAMKVLPKKRFLFDKSCIVQALRESIILKSIQHPFIIELVYAFQSKEKLYMVLEYASRGTLDDILDIIGYLKENEARFYISEIILAIEYLHSRNIIHRDIKPGNILFDAKGHVKVADFGLCKKVRSPQSRLYTNCGTLLFMAPELLQENGYGREVDWWALGVLFYKAIIGRYPFCGSEDDEIIVRINQGRFFIPDEISKEAGSLIRGLLDIGYKSRLGYIGACEIRNHIFFEGTCWKSVLNYSAAKINPPIIAPSTEYRPERNPFKRIFKRFPVDSKHCINSSNLNDELFKKFCYNKHNQIEEAQESLSDSDESCSD